MRTMYPYTLLYNVTSPSPISQNFPLSQPAENKIQARVDQTHSRYSLSASLTEVFSYFWKKNIKPKMSLKMKDVLNVFRQNKMDKALGLLEHPTKYRWVTTTLSVFLPLLWQEDMLSSGHTIQSYQPQMNPTRCWARENPTRPPTLSMLRGQRMEQHFTWDKPFTTEISHTITNYIFLSFISL